MHADRILTPLVYRPNLRYRVLQLANEEEKREEAIRLARQTSGHGILYAATVRSAQELQQALHQAGEQAALCHGKMNAKDLARSQEAFMRGECRLLIAANASGMGIDQRDIRFVLHYQLPSNLETYYQESGYAGRDGAPAACTLLYHADDKRVQEFFIARRYPGVDDIAQVYAALQSLGASGTRLTPAQLRTALKPVAFAKLQAVLNLLAEDSFVAQDSNYNYRLLEKNAGNKALTDLAAKYDKRRKHERDALRRMVFYAQTGFCRWKVLFEYFGEKTAWDHCGSCDNCRHASALTANGTRPTAKKKPVPAQQEAPLLKAGSAVKVPKYGVGKIVTSSGDKITIVFPNSDTRTFLRGYVQSI